MQVKVLDQRTAGNFCVQAKICDRYIKEGTGLDHSQTIHIGHQVLFDHNGCIKKYNRVEDILREFFEVRLDYYGQRKQYMEGMLSAESLKLDNIARFILEKIEGKIVIGKLCTHLLFQFGLADIFFILKGSGIATGTKLHKSQLPVLYNKFIHR